MNRKERETVVRDIHHCLSLLNACNTLDRMAWDTSDYDVKIDRGCNNIEFKCEDFQINCFLTDEDDIVHLSEEYCEINAGESSLWCLIFAMCYNKTTKREYDFDDFTVDDEKIYEGENEKICNRYFRCGDYDSDKAGDRYGNPYTYYITEYGEHRNYYQTVEYDEEFIPNWYLESESGEIEKIL